MNIWANAVITDKGLALQAKLTQGHTLEITRAVTGAGYVMPAMLAKQAEVTDPKLALHMKAATYPEIGKCALLLDMNNDDVTAGYTARQVGIFANDPDEGEILYFIAQAADENTGTIIPSAAEMPGYSAEWTFYFQYGQADRVDITVDPTGTVSRAEMEIYINQRFAPITNEQIDAILGE